MLSLFNGINMFTGELVVCDDKAYKCNKIVVHNQCIHCFLLATCIKRHGAQGMAPMMLFYLVLPFSYLHVTVGLQKTKNKSGSPLL